MPQKILVVDDDEIVRTLHCAALKDDFETIPCASGTEAIDYFNSGKVADLVLLDIEMPAPDGYETCWKIRESSDCPIIFVTSHRNAEEHVQAIEAGGDDIIVKPIEFSLLKKKVALAIGKKQKMVSLMVERNELSNQLKSAQSCFVRDFIKGAMQCYSHQKLLEFLVSSAASIQPNVTAALRDNNTNLIVSSTGEVGELEKSTMQRASGLGDSFRLGGKLIVNTPNVTIMISGLRAKDSLGEHVQARVETMLGIIQAIFEMLNQKADAHKRTEHMQMALSEASLTLVSLREQYRAMLLDVRLLLDKLKDDVEKTYSWLATNQEQEEMISGTVESASQKILDKLAPAQNIDVQFAQILAVLENKEKDGGITLF